MTALELDHVGFMVHGLDAGEALWRRLGFTLSRRSRQMGFDKASGRTQNWASANHIVPLRRGYLELIGIVDPAAPNPWAGHLAKGEGAHILAIRCGRADPTYERLGAVQDAFDPPVDRRRQAPYGDGEREMRFRNIFSRDAATPEARWILIEHQTPEVIWQDALMTHANGAVSLEEVVLCGRDTRALTDRVGGILSDATRQFEAGVTHFAARGGGSIAVADPVAFAALYEDERPPERPCIAAVRIGVANVARSFDYLTAAGFVAHRGERPDSFWISAAEAGGCVLEFVQADRSLVADTPSITAVSAGSATTPTWTVTAEPAPVAAPAAPVTQAAPPAPIRLDLADLELDHIGVAVGNLDMGEATYERLGFRLTPRSLHSGAVTPGGPVEPWGSGNHCAMFVRGYLEILGITDPSLHSSAKAMLAKYEGAHIVALGVKDATGAYETLSRRTPGINPMRALERDAAYGTGTRRAKFRNVYTTAEAFPEARFIFIEHLTPEVIWQPTLLDHPNGTLGILEVAICTANLAESRMRLAALLGTEPDEDGHGGLVWRLGRGALRLLSESALDRWAPGTRPPHVPCVCGLVLEVGHLHKTRDILEAQGVETLDYVHDQGDDRPALRVDAAETHGIVLAFVEAEDRTHPREPLVGPQ